VRQLIVGDIHGCYAELCALLDLAGLSSEDEIVAIGDIVDRGPESPQVLDSRFLSVPSRANYWEQVKAQYRRAHPGTLPCPRHRATLPSRPPQTAARSWSSRFRSTNRLLCASASSRAAAVQPAREKNA